MCIEKKTRFLPFVHVYFVEMIDWLTIIIALVIIIGLVGGFGYLTWKMNMSDPLMGSENQHVIESNHEKKRKEKNASDQSKKKQRKENQKKSKREIKDEEQDKSSKRNPPTQTSEETDDEREESEQVTSHVPFSDLYLFRFRN